MTGRASAGPFRMVSASLSVISFSSISSASFGLTGDYYDELFVNRTSSIFYVPPFQAVGNSLAYAALTVILSLLFGFPAAAALARQFGGVGIGLPIVKQILQAHGSPVLLRHVVEIAMSCGARLAEPGEFTFRAYLRGRIDLPQAEAVADLVDAVEILEGGAPDAGARAAARASCASVRPSARSESVGE